MKDILTSMENSLTLACAHRDPVHQPGRPGMEPSSQQLDREEGDPDRESQPDHPV